MAERRQVIVDLITRTQGGTKGIKSLKNEMGGVTTSANSASKSVGNLGTAGANASKGVRGLAQGLRASPVAMGLVAGGAFAVAAGLKSAVSSFASFDDKLKQSQAIMGDLTEDQMEGMEQAARDVAKTTRLSADDAAESFFFLASAGLDAEQSMAALPQVAAFAQAGMFDMATATDLLTDAQSALGLTSDDASTNLRNMTKVSDIFTKANQLANTSVQQVSEAITNKLGGSLRAAGIDLEEGVAVLAAFADQGLKGSAAGEAFNIALRDLSKAARENGDAFEAAGVEVFDEAGNFRNMADIIADLEGAFGSLTAEQKANLASQLGFQDRSFKNIQLLLGTSDAVREYERELRSAGGATAEVADKQLESFSGQMDLIGSRIKDVGIGLGEELAPGVLDAAGGFATLIESISPLIGLIGKLIGGIGQYIGLLGDGVNAMRSFFDPAVRSALRLEEATQGIIDAGEDGQKTYDAFANGVLHLARSGALTAESLTDLSNAAGLSEESMGGALATNLEFARANGFAADQIEVMEDALRASIEASTADNEEKSKLLRKYGLLEGATLELGGSMLGAARTAEELAMAEEEVAEASEEATDTTLTLADALAAAEEAQTSLASAMRAFVDPAFAAVKAIEGLETAQADLIELQESGKASAEELARAELDVALAVLEAQGALDTFSAGNIEEQVGIIAAALGISDQAARDLLETLGIIDSTSVSADATVVFSAGGSQAARQAVISSGARFAGVRQHGGRGTKGDAFLVGEAGPELFIPDSAGMIVPNDMLQAGAQTTETHTTINFVNPNLANDPVKAIRSRFAFDALAGNA